MLRHLSLSHQYRPLFPLESPVKWQALEASALTRPPSGEHNPAWRAHVLTPKSGESCLSLQAVRLFTEPGHCTVRLSPRKNCRLLGIKLSKEGCIPKSMERDRQRNKNTEILIFDQGVVCKLVFESGRSGKKRMERVTQIQRQRESE